MTQKVITVNPKTSVLHQYCATICGLACLAFNLISLAQGTAIGWLSPFLPLLQSEDSPLQGGPVSDEEASWIASLLCVGAFMGTFFFGWSADKYGRKLSLCLAALPLSGFWACVIFGQTVEILYLGRLFSGLAGAGVFVLVPLYVSEIAEDRIRGSLGSIFVLFINIGTLLSFVAGTFLRYHVVAITMFFVPIIFVICFTNLPETPQHLIKINKIEAAESSLKYLRGFTNEVEQTQFLKIEIENMSSQIVNSASNDKSSKIGLDDFSSTATRKALMVGLVLIALNQFSGCFALINYTAQIFDDAGSTLSPNISAIIVGVIQIAGSYASTILVDRVGRKLLYIVSAFGSGVGLAAMGTHAYLKAIGFDVTAINWIPVVSLSFVIFIASVGILPLAFVVLSEILPHKIRSFGTSLCTAFLWVFGFIVIKYFSSMIELLGMHGCMWIFAGCCFFGVIFNALFVPETKGKSLEEIIYSMESTK